MSCPDCFKGAVHEHGTPKGTFQRLHGYDTYVTGQAGVDASRATIIYLPDAFGLTLINNKLLADRYAQETGFRVLVPDIIPGGGAPVSLMANMEAFLRPAGWNLLSWASKIFNLVQVIFKFVPFQLRAGAPKVYPSVLAYTRAVRQSLPADAKLGICGFCWGGYGATNVCVDKVGGKNLVDAAFTAHPSALKTPDMIVDAVAAGVPYSCAVAESDIMVDAKVARQMEAVLREKVGMPHEKNYELVIHEGCHHGFAVRANPDHEREKQGSEDAVVQATTWFARFLK